MLIVSGVGSESSSKTAKSTEEVVKVVNCIVLWSELLDIIEAEIKGSCANVIPKAIFPEIAPEIILPTSRIPHGKNVEYWVAEKLGGSPVKDVDTPLEGYLISMRKFPTTVVV